MKVITEEKYHQIKQDNSQIFFDKNVDDLTVREANELSAYLAEDYEVIWEDVLQPVRKLKTIEIKPSYAPMDHGFLTTLNGLCGN